MIAGLETKGVPTYFFVDTATQFSIDEFVDYHYA